MQYVIEKLINNTEAFITDEVNEYYTFSILFAGDNPDEELELKLKKDDLYEFFNDDEDKINSFIKFHGNVPIRSEYNGLILYSLFYNKKLILGGKF